MEFGLNLLNQLAVQAVEFTGLTAFTFFLSTMVVATLLLLLDLNKGASLEVPGTGQIGVSAAVLIFGATVMLLAAEGYQFFFIEVGKSIVALVIVAPIVGYFMTR